MTIADVVLTGKTCFVRVDFNVPQDKVTNEVTDWTRVDAATKTIKYLVEEGAKVVLASHCGRPKGEKNAKYSLACVMPRLNENLGKAAKFVPDCIGDEMVAAVKAMAPGDVILLENTRFYPGEEAKSEADSDAFAAQVAPEGLYDVYVNDAFGTSHRKNASMWAVAKRIGVRVAGFLLATEAEQLTKVYNAPQEGFIVVLGGAKVSDKIGVIKSLLPKAEKMLIGGAMSWAFFKAQGKEIGESLCDEDSVASANDILANMSEHLSKLVLPVDVHMMNKADEAEKKQVPADQILPGWDALDIGPETAKMYSDFVLAAKTVFWNGPMGYFEKPPFDAGTLAVAKAMGDCPGFNVVGGGDSVAAVVQMGLAEKIDHVSTGGGASLELLEFGSLPGIDVLDEKCGCSCCGQ